MVFKKGVFCKGLLCDAWNRKDKAKCHKCGVLMCSLCTMKEDGKKWCVNCYIKSFPEALNQDLDNLDKPKHEHKKAFPDKEGVIA